MKQLLIGMESQGQMLTLRLLLILMRVGSGVVVDAHTVVCTTVDADADAMSCTDVLYLLDFHNMCVCIDQRMDGVGTDWAFFGCLHKTKDEYDITPFGYGGSSAMIKYAGSDQARINHLTVHPTLIICVSCIMTCFWTWTGVGEKRELTSLQM